MIDRVVEAIVARLRFVLLAVALFSVSVGLRFGLETDEHFDVDARSLAPFITSMGALYGVLAAFTIYVVWDQFIEAGKSARTETKELLDACRYATYMNDERALSDLVTAIEGYTDVVLREEWGGMKTGFPHPQAQSAFEYVYEAVNAVRFDDDRDHVAWGKMIEKIEAASDARQLRIELSGEHLPGHLRTLLWMASLMLLFGFFMISIHNDFLAIAVTAASTVVVVMTIEVIQDLDDPFTGHWAHSEQPFVYLQKELARFRTREEARA
jgi:hypothetical protein